MLLLPSIDRLRFNDLTRIARTGIARRAPAWTNHNAADPGITLLDLAGALAELTAFELDQFPEPLLRAFLDLAGFAPRPVAAAEVVLLVGGAPTYRTLPPGLGANGPAGLTFSTAEPVYLSPARLVAASAGGRPLSLGPGGGAADPFAPRLGAEPWLDLAFDAAPAPAGQPFRLALWTDDPARDTELRAMLAEAGAAAGAVAWCGQPAVGLYRLDRHYGVRVGWDYLGADGTWRAATVIADDTRALTLSGCVALEGPPEAGPEAAGPDAAGRFRFRARLAAGAYDAPLRLAGVALNAVRARHAWAIDGWETLAPHRGQAGETRPLARGPALPETLRLRVTAPGGPTVTWDRADGLDRLGPDAARYALAESRRAVGFGDGRHGAVPGAGAALAVRYETGGGAAGNLAAGALGTVTDNADFRAVAPADWAALAPVLTLAQPDAARGGRDAETVASARARLALALAQPGRMTTPADLETRALSLPGLPVARAYAMADVHPDFPGWMAVGSTALVIVPGTEAPWRNPSAAFAAAVRLALEPARGVTSELHVLGPAYVPVSVTVTVSSGPGAPRDLARRIAAALDAYLDPFAGGAEGGGWRPGATLFVAEVEAVIARLPGVSCVEGLSLIREGCPDGACARLTLCATELPLPGPHRIAVTGLAACRPEAGGPEPRRVPSSPCQPCQSEGSRA